MKNNIDKDLILQDINEMADLIVEYADRDSEIWESDMCYQNCVEAALKNSSKTIGRISGKLTALMIELGRS